jgi:Ca-activated chloride channel family protein
MRRYNLLPGAGLLALLSLASCSEFQGKLKIVEGSFFHAQGMYTEAISAYRTALGYSEAAPYGEYDLGCMYLSLEEGAAALKRFTAAQNALEELGEVGHTELRYRLHYNAGVIRFLDSDYAGAAGEFRKALEADGNHIEAKRNLELSLLSINRPGASAPPSLENSGNAGGGDDVLFDYLRRKEQDRWKSREWAEDTPVSGPDY